MHTLHRQDASALRASTHKLDFSSIHFNSHDTDKKSVCGLGPGNEVVGSTAQKAPIQGPEARTNSRQLHRNRELLTSDCSAVYQAFSDFSLGF